MTAYTCCTCGVQYEPSQSPPAVCKICSDDRQYIGSGGQQWTTLQQINKQYKNIIEQVAEGVYAIYTAQPFAIGQRAHLVLSPSGNVLWDCITNLDQSTIRIIEALGGIKVIAVSHPHYFSTIVEWSKAFNNAPVYINALDQEWLCRNSPSIHLWHEQELELWDGITLIRCGGHFPGASVMYVPAGKGALYVGDTIQVTPNPKILSFMYSYPNLIPLPKKEILQIAHSVEHLQFDTMYGAFGKYVHTNAKEVMQRSLERYLQIYD
jgi:glyoxylase-like metal-dependent hydrolase (beta-lactamase superfamily II)